MTIDQTTVLVERLREDPEAQKLIARLDMSGECWLWTGSLDKRGRGRVWRGGKATFHYRAVWEALIGPIPEGALLCHHCDNPQCANPAHLYIGDAKSNVRDMFDRGRHWTQRDPERAKRRGSLGGKQNTWSSGADNPNATLSPQAAQDILASTKLNRELAEEYGVSVGTIGRIKAGKHWSVRDPSADPKDAEIQRMRAALNVKDGALREAESWLQDRILGNADDPEELLGTIVAAQEVG